MRPCGKEWKEGMADIYDRNDAGIPPLGDSSWGKARDFWDGYYAVSCGNPEPHPRHRHRAFAGGHNTDDVTCLGRPPREGMEG